MTLGIDHVLIAVEDLDLAIEQYQNLGFEAYYGGEHPNHGTHNALVPFSDGFYLELIAMKDPELANQFPHTSKIASTLEKQNRYMTFALDADILDFEISRLRQFGHQIHDPIDGGRKRYDGVDVAWKTAHFEDGGLPFIIEDITQRGVRIPTPSHGLGQQLGLWYITLASPNASELEKIYKSVLHREPDEDLRTERGYLVLTEGQEEEIQSISFLTYYLDEIKHTWDELGVPYKLEEPPSGGSVLTPQVETGAAFQIIST